MKKNRKSSGFTVIELLIVIIIISLVASIGTSAYQNQRAQVRYNDSIFKVLSMIKTARNYAVSSRPVFDTCELPGEESYIPEEGYGLYIERSDDPGLSRFVLFANTETDDVIESNQFDEEVAPCDSDLIEEEYFLPLDTVFVDLLTETSGPTIFDSNTNADENEAVFIFRPPLAETYIAANDHPLTEANLTEPNELYLEFRRSGSDAAVPSKYIHMNRIAGFPEIENE